VGVYDDTPKTPELYYTFEELDDRGENIWIEVKTSRLM
jgi:hypothetical protein